MLKQSKVSASIDSSGKVDSAMEVRSSAHMLMLSMKGCVVLRQAVFFCCEFPGYGH